VITVPNTSYVGASMDTAFASNGDAVVMWSLDESAAAGGAILVTRVSPQGAIRQEFGADGLLRVSCAAGSGPARFGTRIAVDVSDRVVVTGVGSIQSDPRAFVARFDSNGVPDSGFGPIGCRFLETLFPAAASSTPADVLEDESGKLLLALARPSTLLVARLSDAGIPDASFGTGGLVEVELTSWTGFPEIALGLGGRIYAAQSSYVFEGATQRSAATVVALTSTGALDSSFNTTGRVTYLLPGDLDAGRLGRMATSASGGVLLAGNLGPHLALLRLDASGALDNQYCDSFSAYEAGLGTEHYAKTAGIFERDGRIVLLGSVGTNPGASLPGDLIAVGLRPDLTFVDGFEPVAGP
jgi:uncharacterized delta-60 repeat protein